jgi:hypothetical protein
LLVLCSAALVTAAPAGAATNPEAVHLAKTLKASMVKRYKKAAPGLSFTTVTCKLPSSGTVAHCTANFDYKSGAFEAKGSYAVRVKLLETGKITWTAGSPKCRNAKTGKAISC